MLRLPGHRAVPALALALATSLTLAACGGGGFEDSESGGSSSDGGDGGPLKVLIGSSGEAETKAVEEAVAAWAEENGTEESVQAATDLPQELSQGFTSNNPPDVFYVSTDTLAGFAANGSLLAYGDQLDNAVLAFRQLGEAPIDGV